MNTDLLSQALVNVSKIHALGKKTVFSIATTAKLETESYLTPIRVCEGFSLTGCIVFDQQGLLDLLDKIDGKVDIILADSENLIPLYLNKDNNSPEHRVASKNTDGISEICFKHVSKSEVFGFKPSDLTVNAAWLLISQRLGPLIERKISILGAGNIGSKLALKLAECGAKVQLFRRDSNKGREIISGLNRIKSNHASLNMKFYSDPLQASAGADVLIGASNGHQVVSKAVVDCVAKSCLVIDLGKNNLSREAVNSARQRSLEIYRTDITPAMEAHVYEILKMNEILKYSYGKKYLDFCTIVGGGFFGDFGDIVVDSIHRPSEIFGVAQGDGLLKNQLTESDTLKIKRLQKEIGERKTLSAKNS